MLLPPLRSLGTAQTAAAPAWGWSERGGSLGAGGLRELWLRPLLRPRLAGLEGRAKICWFSLVISGAMVRLARSS
jgi:hypothetical protein